MTGPLRTALANHTIPTRKSDPDEQEENREQTSSDLPNAISETLLVRQLDPLDDAER